MTTKKKSKLNAEQVKVRASAIRAYGLQKFVADTGMKMGTLSPILAGYRDSRDEEIKRQSAVTGIPLQILNPVSFGPNGVDEFLVWLKEHLVHKKTECTDDEWDDIGITVKGWFK
jgi:hypothetical protein